MSLYAEARPLDRVAAGKPTPLWLLTFPALRLELARIFVIFCFVWPYFNYQQVAPDSTMEINFLPVFLAAVLVPGITLRQKWSVVLAVPVLAVASLGASPAASLRVAIGIVPFHFVLNLTRYLRSRGEEILPPNLAYRTLQIFVAFCVLQTLDMNYFHLIPDQVTQALATILPRYSGEAYDDFGIRGVQGWASEPSGAAVACAAYALVAIFQRPDRRWRVLALFGVLAGLNKSIYALVLLAFLGIACLAMLKRKRYAALALIPVSAGALFLILHSARVADLNSNLAVGGMSMESNRELARLVQIFSPLQQFPHVYQPPTLFGTIVMEPMGLLPLVAGYGSVFGLIWILYMLRRNFLLGRIPMRPLAIVAALILLMMVAPDFIPAVVALAVFMAPRATQAAKDGAGQERGMLNAACLDRDAGL